MSDFLSEYVDGVSISRALGPDNLLCVTTGWDCADLDLAAVARLRDKLNEWLESNAGS